MEVLCSYYLPSVVGTHVQPIGTVSPSFFSWGLWHLCNTHTAMLLFSYFGACWLLRRCLVCLSLVLRGIKEIVISGLSLLWRGCRTQWKDEKNPILRVLLSAGTLLWLLDPVKRWKEYYTTCFVIWRDSGQHVIQSYSNLSAAVCTYIQLTATFSQRTHKAWKDYLRGHIVSKNSARIIGNF